MGTEQHDPDQGPEEKGESTAYEDPTFDDFLHQWPDFEQAPTPEEQVAIFERGLRIANPGLSEEAIARRVEAYTDTLRPEE